MEDKLNVSILDSFSKVDEKNIDQKLKEALQSFHKKIVVLDDDPTGVQTVHDVSVYTDWSEESIYDGFAEKNSMFFVLTNSRGMTVQETEAVHKEIAQNILKVSAQTGKEFLVISRSDSTLRGHYPLETETLKETLEAGLNMKLDGEILLPFFKEGGRFTINNVHYVMESDNLIPAAQTEFAKDKSFGYKASHLGKWCEEKTGGRFKEKDVTYISLEDLRKCETEKITEAMCEVTD
ncbi:MAG: four-carbon acid sugar kinase family protein, partial [Eubacterium sp.]|nr:four-carbon acid sugar kinase family protein [Eubacterium sp.]